MKSIVNKRLKFVRHLLNIILVVLASGFAATGQNVTGAEYFFDSDPGVGNGNPLITGTPADSVNFNSSVSVTGLGLGYHMLYVRTLADNNTWSLHKPQRFYIKSQLVAAEYFIDTDPGVGNGTPISVGSAFDTTAFSLSFSTTGLTPGVHAVYTRTKDNRGQWSLHASRRFFIKKDIVAAEYFWDADPGAGNATPLSVAAALDSVGFNGTVSTSGLEPGYHTLCVRTKSGEGRWSLYDHKRIYIRNSVVAAEYYFDVDPGPGNAYPYTVTNSSDSVDIQDGLVLPSLTPGWHYLYFRTKDATGRWSLSHTDSVDVLPFTCLVPTVSLSGANVSCHGGSDGAITLGTTGGSTPFSYQWTGPNSFASIQQNVSGLPAGMYQVQVTAFGGCHVTDSLLITQPDEIIATANNNSPFCSGGDLNLSVVTNYDTSATTIYTWSGPAGFNSSNNNPVITGATPTVNGTYKVVITTGNNCKDSAATAVNILPIATYFADADGDGYGNAAVYQSNCSGAPTGYVSNDSDCDDNNDDIHPGAAETCNGIDDDCDGQSDEGLIFTSYYADTDGDGYGDPATSVTICSSAPAGYVQNNTDCNDTDSLEHPGQVWYTDVDGDDYGGGSATQCTRPANGYLAGELIVPTGDCDDNDPSIHPGAQTLSFSGTSNFISTIAYPQLGSSYTTFQFEVEYTDVNNQMLPAFYPRLLLDYEGNGHITGANDRTIVMTEADVSDTTTSDGKIYIGSINSLPTGTNWQTRVIVSEGACNTVLGPFNYPDVLVQPDLELFANDIGFSTANPGVGSPLTVSAVVHNPSDYFAQNFHVHLVNQYDTTIVYPDVVVSTLAPHATTTVSWNITTPSVLAWCPMEVSIDYTDVITETNELNNSAIRPFINGNYNLPGGIVADGHCSPATAYTTASHIGVYGSAHYTGTAVPLPDSSVAGATVSFTIVETGATYSTYTNAAGNYSFAFPSPGVPGIYHIQGSVTDFTLTGTFNAEFTLVLPPTPVVCPHPDLVSGISVSGPGGAIVAGTPVSGTFTVTNVGPGASAATVLEITQSGGAPTFTSINVPALAPGASYNSGFSNLVFNTPGTYSVCLNADEAEVQQECNETNNQGCRLFTVIPALPDIYPYSGTTGTTHICSAGQPSFTLYNAGGVSTGSFECAIVVALSGNPIDTLYHTVNNMPAQQFTSFTIPYSYPSTGNFSFELNCDVPLPDGLVAETNEGNNSATFGITVLDCRPDLSMVGCESFDVAPADPSSTGNITLTATVKNNGNATAVAPITVRFSLSGGATYTATHNTDLAPNQSFSISTSAAAVAPATETLTATVDPDNTIAEFNEADNSITDNMCAEFAPVPKCVLESNFWMQTYHVNQVVPLAIGVATSGLYDVSSVKVRFKVSGPGITGTVSLGDATVTNVEQTCGCPVVAALPNSFVFPQTGTYTITMISDPANQYSECNEANNTLVRTVTVTNLPDMRILSQHIAPSKLNPEPNEPITMNVSYENIGQANINDQMALKILVDNVPLSTVYPVTGLVTGGTTTYTIPASWSSGLTGIHIIRAVIDANGQVPEGNESNNEATRAVVVGQASNMYFPSFMVSNYVPSLNDQVDIEATIGNNGDVDVEGDVVFSYVNNSLDTVVIGSVHVAVPDNDSVTVQMPWAVADPSAVLIGKIVNASSLEFTYDDNMTSTITGGPPAITFTAGAACSNTPGSLAAIVSGGEAPYSFSWSTGATTQTLDGPAGSYTVIVTDIFGRTDTATGEILVGTCCPCNDVPKKPALSVAGYSSAGSATNFCPGDTVVISVNTLYATTCTYSWTAPANTTIVDGQESGSITLAIGSGYDADDSVAVVAHNSCGSSVQVYKRIPRGGKPQAPSLITGELTALCGMQGVQYSVIEQPSVTYNWYFDSVNTALNSAAIAGGQGASAITVDFAGNWVTGMIFVSANNACGTSNSRKLHGLKPLPATPDLVTGPGSVCPYETGVAFSIPPIENVVSYTWVGPLGSTISDGTITSATNTLTTTSNAITVNFGNKGGRVLVNGNSCAPGEDRAKWVRLTCGLKPSSVEEEVTAAISLFPNPAHDRLNIVFDSPDEKAYTLRVFDALGKEVIQKNETAYEGTNQAVLNVEGLAAGVYQLVIQNETIHYKERFVVD